MEVDMLSPSYMNDIVRRSRNRVWEASTIDVHNEVKGLALRLSFQRANVINRTGLSLTARLRRFSVL
jgi:hypothetical protein